MHSRRQKCGDVRHIGFQPGERCGAEQTRAGRPNPRLSLTDHAALRCAQRGLSSADLRYVQGHARRYHGWDADYYFLRRIDIPLADRRDMARLEGTALVVAKDGSIITVWRNHRHGLRNIRHKLAASP